MSMIITIFPRAISGDIDFNYSVEGEKLLVTLENDSDEFDFSDFTENDVFEGIETHLRFTPILEVKRENGILHVTITYWFNLNLFHEEEIKQRTVQASELENTLSYLKQLKNQRKEEIFNRVSNV